MKLPNIYFPHFFRIKPAPSIQWYTTYVFWTAVLVLIVFNVTFDVFYSGIEKTLRLQVLKKDDVSSLEQLANFSIAFNAEFAREQFYLAQDRTSNVLGAQNSPLSRWEKLLLQKEDIQKEINKWETIFLKHPDYRFAAVKLATLYIQSGDKLKSKYYLDKAVADAPHDPLPKLIEQEEY